MKLAKLLAILLLIVPTVWAQKDAEPATTHQLTAMLHQFLADAGNGNRAGFDRFFADDVIYTGSNGIVRDKTEIMNGVANMKPTPNKKTTYSAVDITVHDFGNAAVVAFRLVARAKHKDGKIETDSYRNTGTFVRRDERWQVVAWQATKIPKNGVTK
ncbi:MAG TPA: nuclear transport factor 2 family protein [Candidatus Acidoferrales bacterium]|nr:nuclear transport factor 2 family protein [Candidatus Acidoferrales bacterium]